MSMKLNGQRIAEIKTGAQIYYLAYGSNMATARLQRRIASAQKLCVVRLAGHRLTFDNRSSKDGSGKCDALLTGNPADFIYAVLYRMAAAEKSILDGYEGLGLEYRDAFISVSLPTGEKIEALIYYATNLAPGIVPYCWYRQHVVSGAEENALPADYVATIKNVQTIPDDDREREMRELSIYPLVAGKR